MNLLGLPTVEHAWKLMQAGYTLADASRLLAVNAPTLDCALWHWRARETQSNPTRGAVNDAVPAV